MTATNPEAVLRPLRDRIDMLDEQMVTLLADRMSVVEEVVRLKQAHGLPARLEGRIEEVVVRVRAKAERHGAPADLAETLWRTMIEWVIVYEDGQLTR